MAQRVMLKRAEKAKQLFDELGKDCAFDDFYERFKELFPKDWERIKEKNNKEEQKTKEGKRHPMPHPTQYVKNLYNTYRTK